MCKQALEQRRFCTVVTDASFCTETKAGGWAVWIVCNGERLKAHGKFKEKCKDSSETEVKAIINGIKLAIKHFNATSCHIVSDCKSAMTILERGKVRKYLDSQVMRDIRKTVNLSFAHVKAHNGTSDRRSYVNDWCDKQARSEMFEMRKDIRQSTCANQGVSTLDDAWDAF